MTQLNYASSPSETFGIDQIVKAVEEDIVLGRLNPKERLVEEDLIERFNCKRHAVRQALFQLETIGLVERIKNRGAFVKAYTPAEVEQLYAMRELLETAGARSIPLPAPPEMLAQLIVIQEQHSDAIKQQDLHRVFRLNIAFHRTLFSATGNSYLSDCINEFAQKAHSIRFMAISDAASLQLACNEHFAMIDAIQKQDRDRLCQLCMEHLIPSKERYLSLARLKTRSN
ncbi:GntR family transcriptional regulator [Halomonas sp. AOP12-C2-37]|uniref:GntR family transcriptional regulator n=1 Tax=unclassified Halomonas TaxID=2609666 RepID=UPI004034C893